MGVTAKNIYFLLLLFLLLGCSSTKSYAPSGEIEIAKQYIFNADYKAATAQLQNLRRKYPDDFNISNILGTAYLGLGDAKAALLAFEHATSLSSENFDGYLNLAYAQILLKKLPEARKTLDIIIGNKSYQYIEKAYVNYGLSYLEEKNCPAAMEYFRKSLDVDPTYSIAHFNQGKCYFLNRNYEKAVQSFQKAANFCANCFDPVYELARSYYYIGQKKLAIQKLETLLGQKIDKISQQKAKNLIAQYSK